MQQQALCAQCLYAYREHFLLVSFLAMCLLYRRPSTVLLRCIAGGCELARQHFPSTCLSAYLDPVLLSLFMLIYKRKGNR
eukprot:1154028-Pelagomonas_calceolata.AAC.3